MRTRVLPLLVPLAFLPTLSALHNAPEYGPPAGRLVVVVGGTLEGTAIIVTGDTFEVMGKWKVAIHDNTRVYQPWEKPYYVLSPGDVYNMKTRRVEKLGTGVTPRSDSMTAPQSAASGRIPITAR